MTIDEHAGSGALRARRSGDVLVVEDRSCRACDPCRAGFVLWCVSPAPGSEVLRLVSDRDPDAAIRSLTAAAALCTGDVDPISLVLAVDDDPGDPDDALALHRLVRHAHQGPLLAARHTAAPGLREELAGQSELGRADVIVTTGQARAAVKAVRRGGTVFLPNTPIDGPSVTELVQREVRLVGARDLRPLIERLTSDWSHA